MLLQSSPSPPSGAGDDVPPSDVPLPDGPFVVAPPPTRKDPSYPSKYPSTGIMSMYFSSKLDAGLWKMLLQSRNHAEGYVEDLRCTLVCLSNFIKENELFVKR